MAELGTSAVSRTASPGWWRRLREFMEFGGFNF
jgi:hypothetical protein